MYSIEPLMPEDIFNLNLVNLDPKTENYSFGYYLHYMLEHPEDCIKIRGHHHADHLADKHDDYLADKHEDPLADNMARHIPPSGAFYDSNDGHSADTSKYPDSIWGYIIGKHEINSGTLSAHVTALSVSSLVRNSGMGSVLMNCLEANGNMRSAWFTDLFVRVSNLPAIRFYENRGYGVYRVVKDYYQDPNEDAYDMRKSLDRDKDKVFMKRIDETGNRQ